MLARRLLLVVAVVFAATLHHAAGQCLTEPYSGSLETTVNAIPSDQQPCFNTLQVNFVGCSVTITSNEDNCDWLTLSGTISGNAAAVTRVQVAGPLSLGAGASQFILQIVGYYDKIGLSIDGEPNNQATYQVVAGRVLQVKAPMASGGASLGGSSGTASTSTANCNTGTSAMVRIAVSRACPWMKDDECFRAFSVSVSSCNVFIGTGRGDCPRFIGRISSSGNSAVVYVDWPTNSASQTNAGRKLMASSRLGAGLGRKLTAGFGRKLTQSVDQGAGWLLFVAGGSIGLRQGTCGVFYSVTQGQVLSAS